MFSAALTAQELDPELVRQFTELRAAPADRDITEAARELLDRCRDNPLAQRRSLGLSQVMVLRTTGSVRVQFGRYAFEAAVRMGRGDYAVPYAILATAGDMRAGNFEVAHEALVRTLPLESSADTRVTALVQLAELERNMDRGRAARQRIEEAGALLESVNKREVRASFYGVRGMLALDVHRVAAAARDFAAEAEILGDNDPSVQLHRLERVVALRNFGRGSSVGREIANWFRPDKKVSQRGAFYAAMERSRLPGQTGEAIRDLEGIAANEDIGQNLRVVAQARLAHLFIERGEFGRAVEAVERSVATPTTFSAKASLRIARARLALVRDAPMAELESHRERVLEMFGRMLELWDEAPIYAGGIGFLEYRSRRNLLSVLIDLQLRTRSGASGRVEALRQVFRAHARGSFARERGIPAGIADDKFWDLVPPDGGVLVYVPALAGSHVFAISSGSIRHFPLPSDRGLGEAVDVLRSLVRDSSSSIDAIRKAAKGLETHVLPPDLRAAIEPWRELVIVGRDLLGGLPFECLPEPDGWLGLERSIAYLPSLVTGVWLSERDRSERRTPGDKSLVVVAGTKLATPAKERWRLEELSIPRTALEYVTAPVGADRARLITATDVSRSAFDASVGSAELLVLLAHGVHDYERDRPPGLALPGFSERGVAWCEDLEGLALPRCVLLGACGAGRAPIKRGEDGGNHFGGAVLRAGASSVILANEDLDLRATIDLTREFVSKLAAELISPAEALRRARAIVAADAATAHPFYHSQLRVFGLGHTPLRLARPRAQWPWAVGLGAAVAAGWWLISRRSPSDSR